MKAKYINEVKSYSLKDLKPGDVFRHNNVIYMFVMFDVQRGYIVINVNGRDIDVFLKSFNVTLLKPVAIENGVISYVDDI